MNQLSQQLYPLKTTLLHVDISRILSWYLITFIYTRASYQTLINILLICKLVNRTWTSRWIIGESTLWTNAFKRSRIGSRFAEFMRRKMSLLNILQHFIYLFYLFKMIIFSIIFSIDDSRVCCVLISHTLHQMTLSSMWVVWNKISVLHLAASVNKN